MERKTHNEKMNFLKTKFALVACALGKSVQEASFFQSMFTPQYVNNTVAVKDKSILGKATDSGMVEV